MEFIYDYAHLPKNKESLNDINMAAKALSNKLLSINIKSLDISDYNKSYLGHHLGHLRDTLQKYSYILSWSIASANVPLDEFVFLEYGGGIGILSLLAKEAKIGTVLYNDIYDVSCRDAEFLAKCIGLPADYYIHGEIQDVIDFLQSNSLHCDAVASYDVIEHIYDIETFFKMIGMLSSGSLVVFMSSGANAFNPIIRNRLMKQQYEIEHKDREKKWGHKERDTTRSYLSIRKEMIREYNKELSKEEIEQLAVNTRGMIESDIYKCVDNYLKTGRFPKDPCHPTNTCDPYTGNWAEHLMDPYYLKNILSKEGFEVKILSGFYGTPQNILKKLAGKLLNIIIYTFNFNKQGIRIAPFFTIYAKK